MTVINSDVGLEKVSVIGCGTRGQSIALCVAQAGLKIQMYELNKKKAQYAVSNIYHNLLTLAQHGLVQMDDVEEIRSNIVVTDSIDEVINNSTFIIEVTPEPLEEKKSLLSYLDSECDAGVILGSATPKLLDGSIAQKWLFPQRLIMLQFSTPIHLMPVVEVLHGNQTGEAIFERTFRFLKLLGKKPVVVKKDVPGWILDRLSSAIFREAQHILEQGIASKEDIDAVVIFDLGRKFSATGLFLAADMKGLDLCSLSSDHLYQHLSNKDQNFNTITDLVNNNRLGRKSGEGYYLWNELSLNQTDREIEKQLIRFLKNDRIG